MPYEFRLYDSTLVLKPCLRLLRLAGLSAPDIQLARDALIEFFEHLNTVDVDVADALLIDVHPDLRQILGLADLVQRDQILTGMGMSLEPIP